ncbi:glycosyltransferase family 4 protein [Thermaurantimonas aggregans]|uniref:glycosyltransferase family 4 protein n=1 Tax=Thermaurantimonas aggregans TaxID=2173829 RepID=UPI0023F59347|nr:glycosyltransferase family 4 protein [Thermaurantimonas aggregans]MCX8148587.1 glycosyltransferase family 4 protein [Thermaurantimonas aggregans]
MEFPPFPGGIGNHAYNLAYELSKCGYNVDVLTEYRTRFIEPEIEFDFKQPFKIHRVKRFTFIYLTYLQRVTQSIYLVIVNKYDFIICSAKYPIWIGALLSFILGKKKLFSVVHGSEVLAGSSVIRFLTKISLLRYKTIIAVSTYTKNLLLEQKGYKNIVVIPNGFREFYSSKIEKIKLKGNPVLITVGNVTKRKGQQNVIKALPTILNVFPEAHYHIVGLPTCYEEFFELAKNLGVDSHVTFHGSVSSENLPVILAQADIFLMLSERQPDGDVEGFGIAILEANSLGIPAIGSINSGIMDAIKNNYSGILVNPHNVHEILQAIENILDQKKAYNQRAKSWSENFTWDRVIQQYITELGL